MLGFDVAIHIGYHKTATAWFQQVACNAHPQIAAAPRYPLRIRLADDPLVGAVVRQGDDEFDPAAVRANFCEAVLAAEADLDGRVVVVSAERLSGNAGSGGFDAVRIADRLHAVLPEAKVFWMLRNRVDSIRSEYRQLVRVGWTGTPSDTLRTPRYWRSPGFSLDYWDYRTVAAAYLERFGASQVGVFDYDRFRVDPLPVLDELSTFLGISPWPTGPEMVGDEVHPSLGDRAVRLHRLLNYFQRSEFNPYPLVRLPSRARRWVIDQVDRFPGGPPLFDDGLDAIVRERFGDSDDVLAELGIGTGRSST